MLHINHLQYFYYHSTCTFGWLPVLVKDLLRLDSSLLLIDVDEHWTLLKSTCMDCIVPLRPIKHKSKVNPWLNNWLAPSEDNVGKQREDGKRTSSKFTMNPSEICYLSFRKLQPMQKNIYFSIIRTNANNPKFLFSIINSVINPLNSIS